jgi:hypothetical protein
MGVALSDEQFIAEMAKRKETMKLTQSDTFLGCPLCNVNPRLLQAPTAAPRVPGGPQQ